MTSFVHHVEDYLRLRRTRTGTVRRVAEQLGYGVESARSWVKQADAE